MVNTAYYFYSKTVNGLIQIKKGLRHLKVTYEFFFLEVFVFCWSSSLCSAAFLSRCESWDVRAALSDSPSELEVLLQELSVEQRSEKRSWRTNGEPSAVHCRHAGINCTCISAIETWLNQVCFAEASSSDIPLSDLIQRLIHSLWT